MEYAKVRNVWGKGYEAYHNLDNKPFSKFFRLEREAQNAASYINVKHFQKEENSLPKGITLDPTKQKFSLKIKMDKKDVKHVVASRELGKVIQARETIINQLT